MECRNSAMEICSLCRKAHLHKREMNKIYYAPSHYSVVNPRIICHICDDCLPRVANLLKSSKLKALLDKEMEEELNGK